METASFSGNLFPNFGEFGRWDTSHGGIRETNDSPPPQLTEIPYAYVISQSTYIERLLKDKHKRGGYFLCVVKVLYPGIFSLAFFSVVFAQCLQWMLVKCTCCLIYGGVISLNGQPITTYSSIATHQTTRGTCSFGNFSFDSTTVKIRVVMLIE